MWPIADEGPYYAALVAGGTLDTKGGPKVTPDGEVVDDLDRPIRGLFGVGNCVAAAAGARLLGGRRDARTDDRPRLPQRPRPRAAGARALSHATDSGASRTRRERSGANQSTKPSAPPTATIVVTGHTVAAAAASANPTGVSACEPNESKLKTRERRCSGTSSVSSVVQAEAPRPIPKPRQIAPTIAEPDTSPRARRR